MNMDRPAGILVADDDPVSLQFLVAALRELGGEVVGVADGGAVLAACQRTPFDLLVLDRRMPGSGGAALLRELRRRGCTAAAIATSAELDSATRAELAEAGYADAVAKPIGVERLAALLAAHLPGRSAPLRDADPAAQVSPPTAAFTASEMVEDDQALAGVGGDRQTLQALRSLFAAELESALPRIPAMPVDELGDWLHRLRASCRYCGARRLGDATEELERRLKAPGNRGDAELAQFAETCKQTLEALSGKR